MTEEAKPIRGLINIAIDYPHRIILPPGTFPIMLDQGEVGAIKVQHEKGLLIFDKGKTTAEKKSKVRLLHRRKTTGEIKITMSDKSISYVDFDQYGKTLFPKNYTHVEIIFPVNDLRANIAILDNRMYIDNMAEKFFDKFLAAYMFGTGDCAIGLSKKYEWPSASIIKSYDYTAKDIKILEDDKYNSELLKLITKKRKFKPYRGFEKMHGFTSANFHLSDYSNTEKKHCTKEQFRKFFNSLVEISSIEPYFKFIFSSINKSYLKDEHDMAILDLAIAFEVALSFYYSLIMYSFENIEEEDDDNEKIKNIQKEIEKFEEKMTLDDRIKELEKLKLKFNEKINKKYFSIIDNLEYKEWKEIVWKRRHKVAHVGFEGTEKDEIKKGLSLTQKIISHIRIEKEEIREYHKKLKQESE